jgi:preprotein translocase subunit Sec61beta
MSSKKKKKQGAPMSSAGLVRFYEESNIGLKLKPAYIVGISVVFTVLVILASHIPI